MFIGHFALGFGAKKAAPAVSLGTLLVACQFADLLWPMLVLAGVERVELLPGATVVTPLDFVSYPYSHSLLTLCVWGVLFGLGYMIVRRSKAVAAVTIALLVVSHWVLDFISHRPDMPLTPMNATKVGLELWASRPATMAVEIVMFTVGVALYLRTTTARNRIGSIGLWALLIFLSASYLGNMFGPIPPSAAAVVWSAQAMWVLIAWAYWVDAHRVAGGWERRTP
ncbi:MAG: hypothetical protein HY048_14560 [Acidobacteria bacterium]|nr:hypothetical protein [Acidobacteriota bacterium]